MTDCDVVVIGGGSSGLAAAAAIAQAGYSVRLLDRGKFHRATSGNSLRIIHGGFRYLQNLDFPRLFQSLNDQTRMLSRYPEVVKPLSCFMPLKRFGLKSRIPTSIAARIYGLCMDRSGSPLPRPGITSREDVEDHVPALFGRTPYGGLAWHDAVMASPDGLGEALAADARRAGAELREHLSVTRLVPSTDTVRVECSDGESLSSRCVVNTAGPWMRNISGSEGVDSFSGSWCKGFNLFCRPQFNPKHAVGIPSDDGRLFFIVPRGEGSVVGTWYVPVSEISEKAEVFEEEVVTFVEAFNRAVPWWPLRISDLIGSDVGYLPMKRMQRGQPELYGSEMIGSKGRLVEVLSTKYTTCLSQAEGVVGVVKGMLRGDRR